MMSVYPRTYLASASRLQSASSAQESGNTWAATTLDFFATETVNTGRGLQQCHVYRVTSHVSRVWHLLMTMPELRERSSWMVALCSDLFWMTKVTLSSATSLYTSTLLAPRTLVGDESHCIAHLHREGSKLGFFNSDILSEYCGVITITVSIK